MSRTRSWIVFAVFALVLLLGTQLLAGCAVSSTTASLAFVVGNGVDGNDSKVHEIVYPGQQITSRVGEEVSYVPANSRNYIINDGSIKNANGDTVGDRGTLIEATTSTGVPIKIAAEAFWTLNQDRKALENFYNVCFKYQCASTKDIGGTANFSTPGWNGMLAENFGPALDASARIAAIGVDDSIWQKNDPKQYSDLANGMSKVFADVIRARLGYPEDLFCGSGNSTWSDPDKPGEGEFTCYPVRIVVNSVKRGQITSDDSTEGVKAINAQRLENAKALYGPDAGFWLGLQDTIEKCKGNVNCIFNIGGSNGGVAFPVNPTPAPMPTPTTKK